jgi:hypothetical protein
MRQWALMINSIKPPILPNLAATSKRQIGLVNRLSNQGLFGVCSCDFFNQLGYQISRQRIVRVSSIDAPRTSVPPMALSWVVKYFDYQDKCRKKG